MLYYGKYRVNAMKINFSISTAFTIVAQVDWIKNVLFRESGGWNAVGS